MAVTGNDGATDKAAGGVTEKASWKRLLQGKLGGRGQGRFVIFFISCRFERFKK